MRDKQDHVHTTLPLVEERLSAAAEAKPIGRVRVSTRARVETRTIAMDLDAEEVTVERVPVGRWLDGPAEPHTEGAVTIIPVVEEVPVVVTRLRLVEEIRLTRRRRTLHVRETVPVRRSEAVIERLPPEDDGTPPPRAPSSPQASPQGRTTVTTTVIAIFKDADQADSARGALREVGDIAVFGGRDSTPDADAMRRAFEGVGMEGEDIAAFVGAAGKGAVILSVEIDDDRRQDIVALLEKHGATGVDQFAEAARETESLKEVEETVEIGKEKTIRGGVQARTRVTERPVEKTVTLREESVDVRRKDATGELDPEEAEKAFEERSVDMTETVEEAKVRKAAKLIGEVEVSKSVVERDETVKDTARRTEVEVEPLRTGRPPRKG